MSPPWMPLYIADYKQDTGHLSAAEHGAYLLLIMHYWSRGSLPNDDRQLARIACMTPEEWQAARPVIVQFFDDDWRHSRIDTERAKAEYKHGRRVEAGAAAAAKRWGNAERKTRAQRLSEAREKGTHDECEWHALSTLFACCVKCGITADDLHGNRFNKDHVIPISQGGDDSIFNIQPMCRQCNSGKSQKSHDYRAERIPNWRVLLEKRIEAERIKEAKNASEMPAKRMPNASHLPQPQPDKSSVANATGGEPPKSYPVDPVERLWAEGIDAMRAMGSVEREARSNIGRWLRDAKGDATLVLGAIIQARAKGTRDPVALVSRILKPVQVNGKSEDKSVHRAARGLVERVQEFLDDPSGPHLAIERQ